MKDGKLKIGDDVKIIYIAHTKDGKRMTTAIGKLVAYEPTWSTVEMSDGHRKAVPTHQIYPMSGRRAA